MAKEYKLIFTGTMGVGKTTAISVISEFVPVRTEVASSEKLSDDKTTTTAAMDYGEVMLPGGDVLRLYGTPGQSRFDFMWKILSAGALGVVLLVDNRRPDPVADFRDYLQAFRDIVEGSKAVVGICRQDSHPLPDVEAFCVAADEMGLDVPIIAVDVRSRDDVLLLVDILFHEIEAAECDSSSETVVMNTTSMRFA
jgi:signal recognition particle receptor subunit beta